MKVSSTLFRLMLPASTAAGDVRRAVVACATLGAELFNINVLTPVLIVAGRSAGGSQRRRLGASGCCDGDAAKSGAPS